MFLALAAIVYATASVGFTKKLGRHDPAADEFDSKEIRESPALFYAVAALYLFAMTSVGIAIAVVASNLLRSMMIMLLILQPMIFLSGTWNPPEAMSPRMRWLSLILPLRYFIGFGYEVLLKGHGLRLVAWDIVVIVVLGGAPLRVFSLAI